jgi:hypothetical protein
MKKKISFLQFFILVFTTSLLDGFSVSAASGTCPTDNGSGVGCLDPSYPYYCGGVCRGGQTQCPSWTGTICADGVTCPANCAAADACGYCSSCASGYTLCGAYLTRTCTANTTAPSNCTAYDQCTATCTACAQGYILTGGLCEGATLKLGSDSVGALNHIFQSTSPALSILSSGLAGLGTTTPTARLSVVPASGYAILAGTFRIGNVASPLFDDDAATKGYVDSALSSATSSMSNLWSGSLSGNIWNGNSGNVGVGITAPTSKLHVYGTTDITATLATPSQAYSPALLFTNQIDSFIENINSGAFQLTDINGSKYYSVSTTSVHTLYSPLNSPAMTISAGNVGIRTTNPGSTLDVNGYVRSYGASGGYAVATRDSGASPFNAWTITSQSGNLSFYDTSDERVTFQISTGNVGIGTTTPAARLSIVPASNYSLLAGNFKIGNVASPTEDSDVVTLGWVNSALSGIGGSAVYATSTVATYNGSQGGYSGANALCAAVESGSHVCTTGEILYTINTGVGASIPAGTFWISNGPPAYTANANDCQGWTSASGSYGTAWVKLSSGDGFGSLYTCSAVYKFACCK